MPASPRFTIVETTAGAPALLDSEVGEVMHPVVGPLRESKKLYVDGSRLAARLRDRTPLPLVLFDIGLGAGSNAAAAWCLSEGRKGGRPLHIVSFDRSTEALEAVLASEYLDDFGFLGSAGSAAAALIESGHAHGALTQWTLQPGELPGTLANGDRADVVYWDPFSSSANPTLWTVAAFSALRAVCSQAATVHTYSASTTVRAALLLAGFYVGRGPGVGSKRDTTIAATDFASLAAPLGSRWLDRLSRSSAPAPADARGPLIDQIRMLGQFSDPGSST